MPLKDKAARSEYNKQYRARNAEKLQENMRLWYAANQEWVREYRRRPEVRDRIRERDRKRGPAQRATPGAKEKSRERTAAYRARHRERARMHAWALKQTARYKEQQQQYRLERQAAASFLRSIRCFPRGPRGTWSMRVTAAAAYVRQAGLLPPP